MRPIDLTAIVDPWEADADVIIHRDSPDNELGVRPLINRPTTKEQKNDGRRMGVDCLSRCDFFIKWQLRTMTMRPTTRKCAVGIYPSI